MKVEYDKYYQTENYFGEPYPELVQFYALIKKKGPLLDLGCGQGRNAIALARMGYEVTGIDYSKVGVEQLNRQAKKEKIPLQGIKANIYEYSKFDIFDYVLLDSMFHFRKSEKDKEIQLLIKIIKLVKPKTKITICIQNTGNKLKILDAVISTEKSIEIINTEGLVYNFNDKKLNHQSKTKYEMITIAKK